MTEVLSITQRDSTFQALTNSDCEARIFLMTKHFFISAVLLTLTFSALAKDKDYKPIFDGKTLKGWTQLNGTATYRVANGIIIGKTKEGSPNSFLCSDKLYGNFDLKFEVKVDNGLNSGVQIRSNCKQLTEKEKKRGDKFGRVNGPQVEIEMSGKNGAESGYIYGEAAGGWMTPANKRKPHKQFKDEQ